MVETIQQLQAYPDVTAPLGDFLVTLQPTENYSEIALPDSRTIEKPALTFPRSL